MPTLWDMKTKRIVNNESADIIRMLNSAFDHLTGNRLDLYPEALRPEINRWNELIYPTLNNGVYRAGFAGSQQAYEEAALGVFTTLDAMEAQLERTRYLTGEWLTEADWRAFTTLVRFDAGYHGAFKCNLRRIEDYPALRGYLREMYQWPGIATTVKLEEIKRNYYALTDRHGLYPIGPELDLSTPHDRDRLPAKASGNGPSDPRPYRHRWRLGRSRLRRAAGRGGQTRAAGRGGQVRRRHPFQSPGADERDRPHARVRLDVQGRA